MVEGPGAPPAAQSPAAPAPRPTLPKAARLLQRREFLLVQQKGRKLADGLFLALALKTGRPAARLGITVSSKVGNAVVRARIRRLVREAYRHRRPGWPAVDVVVIARGASAQATSAEVARAFDALTARLKQAFP
jgi:ribonuclease P protein component